MSSVYTITATTIHPSIKVGTKFYFESIAVTNNLIKNSQAVKKGAAPIKAMVKKDVKSKVAAKKWLWW